MKNLGTKKSKLAAMKYLAAVKPDKYRLRLDNYISFIGRAFRFILEEKITICYYCGLGKSRTRTEWKDIDSYHLGVVNE